MAQAFLMLRSMVADPAERAGFDRWYADQRLPEAVEAFAAMGASRFWSRSDPSVHYAFYEFADVEAARLVWDGEAMRALMAAFDRHWGGRVELSRELLERAQEIVA